MQLLIYTPKVTPRIKYIFTFIFREILLCDFEFTSIIADFKQSGAAKISYSENQLEDELFFKSDSFLLSNTIAPLDIAQVSFAGKEVPFAVSQSTLPFDLFAASFYFLSRYEEYLPHEPDEHLRFPAKASLQFKLQLLELPIIDDWALILKNILIKQFPSLKFNKRNFKFVPTIDIDRAYNFRSSGLIKNTARIVKAVINLDKEKLGNIITTGLRTKDDPFDTYTYLHDIHAKYLLKPIFFFLLSHRGHAAYDVNIHPEDELLIKLIKETAKQTKVGLHPSYASNSNTFKIKEELLALQTITNKKIDISRQHHLKLNLPKTYLQLIKAGINHDYSMGYASQVGFRAGTCTPFFWYDLQLDKQSHLKIHPFAVMDVTLEQYLNLSPEQAMAKLDELIASVKLVEGTLYTLWHNESLSETGKWKNWKAVYEFILKNTVA